MPALSISTIDLLGQAAPNTPFTIRLRRAGRDAQEAIYGPTGVVAVRDYEGTTDATGAASVDLAGTADYSVQTYYRLRLAGRTVDFTMPAEAASLVSRIAAENVVVAIGGTGEPNVQADWTQGNTSAPSYIRNKPTIPPTPSAWAVEGFTGSIPVALIQLWLTEFLVGAAINGGTLRFTHNDGQTTDVELPTTSQMPDGVVASATYNDTTRQVLIGTSTGAQVFLNLSSLARVSDIHSWARVGSTGAAAEIPAADLDEPFPRTIIEAEDYEEAGYGTAGQPIVSTGSAFGLTDPINLGISADGVRGIFDARSEPWAAQGGGQVPADRVEGAAGAPPLTLLGTVNLDLGISFLTSTGIALDDSQVFGFSFGAATDTPSTIYSVLGDAIRSLTPDTGELTVFRDTTLANIRVGRTAENELLVASNRFLAEGTPPEFMPLSVYAWRATGVGSQDGGGTGNLAVRQSRLVVGPDREDTTSIPDDTAVTPATAEYVVAFAETGHLIDGSIALEADRHSLRIVEAGVYHLQMELEGEASGNEAIHSAISASGVIRAEGWVRIYQNTILIAENSLAYARYGGWRPRAVAQTVAALAADDDIEFRVQVQRIDTGVRSVEWTGRVVAKLIETSGAAASDSGGDGGGDGGGATGQTGGDVTENFDRLAGPTVQAWNQASLFAQADGSTTTGALNLTVPVIREGNVLLLTIASGTTAGPAVVDLYTILADGTYIPTGLQFPRTGETLQVELPYVSSNGTAWNFGVRFDGTENFDFAGWEATYTVIRYHVGDEELMSATNAGSLTPGWEVEFPRPIDPTLYEYLTVELAGNNGDNRRQFILPTGGGDIDLLRPFSRADLPDTYFRQHFIWTAHVQSGQIPVLLQGSALTGLPGTLGFAFLREEDAAPITAVRGVGPITANQGYNLRLRILARRRG